MNEVLKQKLIYIAQRETWLDSDSEDGVEFNAQVWSSGNFDDAFNAGISAGEATLARDILDSFGISWAEE